MKKLAALILVSLFLTGCAPQEGQTVPAPTAPHKPPKQVYTADFDKNYVVTGPVQAVLSDANGGKVTYNDTYAGIPGKDYTDPGFYTRRDYISGTTGMKWAPHTWETNDDSYILELTTTGFYSFLLNSDKTGFTVADEMADGPPADVTQDYIGQFGIEAGQEARAWQVNLNPAACWDNGTKIDADTYLYSYRELLEPKMRNRRADSLYAGDFAIVGARDYLYGKGDWDSVGILKTGQYQLTFITTTPVTNPDFYVPYYLSSTYLVYEPLWESCKTYLDDKGNAVSSDSDKIKSISTNYGTSLSTSVSYGPYKLSYFELDKQITLDRNEAWYGYSDGRHLGQYQTDRISCQVLSNHATALLAFLNGEIDSISLQAADMEVYASSDRIRYAPQTYTTKLSFNTDVEALSKRGTQVLSEPLFRQAFALAIDRARFAAGFTSAGAPGHGILNEMYVYDPFTGAAYRQNPAAKNALVQLYDIRFGDGEVFSDLQEAYDAITGYDMELARWLMEAAYTKCVESGLYEDGKSIRLQLSVYQSEDIYVQMYHFLRDALQAATRGTGFEGRIDLEMVVDADYYATMESGLTDIIFSTWGGSAYDPYGILYQCYCDAGAETSPNQMEYGFRSDKISVEMTVNGEKFVASLQDWARWCAADTQVQLTGEAGTALLGFGKYSQQTKAEIYANLEFAYLSQFVVTPLYYRNGAELVSKKGNYALDAYVGLVEFGGLPFYTYDYTDSQWDAVKGTVRY